MERYVNDGSPSGFTFAYPTSDATCPRSSPGAFKLFEFAAKAGVTLWDLGVVPPLLGTAADVSKSSIYVHPDMLGSSLLSSLVQPSFRESWFVVEPTASARTVRVESDTPERYLKLHYEGRLGRVRRRISLQHAQAATETDEMLMGLVQRGQVPETFAFLRETGARVLRSEVEGKDVQWGMVWRNAQPFGAHADRIRYIVPAFSLF